MNVKIFNKPYWIRRASRQTVVKGYIKTGHTDFAASIHLHPMGADEMLALPEGQRMVKRLEGHGEIKLIVADQAHQTKGDLVFYHGSWYECESCQLWDHTILSHYNYQFVMVPPDASGSTDLKPPVGDPVVQKGG